MTRSDRASGSPEDHELAAQRKIQELEQELHALRRRAIRLEDELQQLRRRRAVKIALRVASWLRPIVKLYRRWRWWSGRRRGDSSTSTTRSAAGDRATSEEQEALTRRLVQTLTDAPPRSGPSVSVVIVNRDGEHHLRRLIPSLIRTEYEPFEIVVVDNASSDSSVSYLDGLRVTQRIQVLRNSTNVSFSEANNQGASATTGELLLFLNNDVEPVEPTWLARMVARIADQRIGAVGARLVYPARSGTPGPASDDLTLQHRGIHFVPGGGYPEAVNLGAGADPTSSDAQLACEVPAVTAACVLLDRDVFERVGGFDASYQYGTEDVDLCLKIREAGWQVWYEASAFLYHHEFGTQRQLPRETVRRNRLLNRRTFVDRWGPRLYREVFEDRLTASGKWSFDPLHVAITVTRDDPDAGYGDFYTARELGAELVNLGWRVSYIEQYRERWYELPEGTDVVLVLLDAFDISRVPGRPVMVAWIRNWVDRWIERPWFDGYDLVLASSRAGVGLVDRSSSHRAILFPLATNPSRFSEIEGRADLSCDVLFAGNRWERPRRVETVIDRLEEYDVRVHGSGWEGTSLESRSEARLAYDELPVAYLSAGVVLDDTADHARPFGSVNSRVFDALASGRPVVTDNGEGVRGLFDDDFPSYETAAEAAELVERFLRDEAARERFIRRYRSEVLEKHTYQVRAETLRDLLLRWVRTPKFAVMTSVPDRDAREEWGDWHFARDLRSALHDQDYPTTVHLLEEAEADHTARADLVIHLFGRSEIRTRPSQLSSLWVISHPSRLTQALCSSYDTIFVGGHPLYESLWDELGLPVIELHQATDPERFSPDGDGPSHELLFVGNSRGVRRKIIEDLLPTDRGLAVYGAGWTRDLLQRRFLAGEHVPNRALAGYYSAAEIVLNDHWPDMREYGIFSNRLYDALAAGAFVISDHVEGIEEEFDGGVVTYRDPEELASLVDRYLENDSERARIAERGRAAVLERHTFGHRVATILRHLLPSVEGRPQRIV